MLLQYFGSLLLRPLILVYGLNFWYISWPLRQCYYLLKNLLYYTLGYVGQTKYMYIVIRSLEVPTKNFNFKTLCAMVIVQGFGYKRQIVKIH